MIFSLTIIYANKRAFILNLKSDLTKKYKRLWYIKFIEYGEFNHNSFFLNVIFLQRFVTIKIKAIISVLFQI